MTITTIDHKFYPTPLFLPVFQYQNHFISITQLQQDFAACGLITNGFFFYKKRDWRQQVLSDGLKKFLGFSGLVVTDSGAFQQFSGTVYLDNNKIIRFQQEIGADIISPLDVITVRGDSRKTAEKKWQGTIKRIRKSLPLVKRCLLIGVQQGGRFMDLRAQALYDLMALDMRYIALGGLVPFFNKNHDIEFIARVILQAREIVPQEIPLHLYGGGDPLELPFYIALGCNVFDSSSFIHYARGGWYMTPYGAINSIRELATCGYRCSCSYCLQAGDSIYENEKLLAAHNLATIYRVMAETTQAKSQGNLYDYLQEIVTVHSRWFAGSRLPQAWERLHEMVRS